MNKLLKYALFAVALALLLCLLPQLAIPAEAATHSGSCGENLTWKLDTETGILTISGYGPMLNYSQSYNYWMPPWYDYRSNIKKLSVMDGVTSIGNMAFYDCSNLTSMNLAGSLEYIGVSSFNNCDRLTYIRIPSGVTRIGSSAFYGCGNLTSVSFPKGLTSIDASAFGSCGKLTSVTLQESLAYVGGGAFSNCTSLQNVYISDLAAWCGIDFGGGGSNPLNGGAMLYLNGEAIEHLQIPEEVTTISDYAFFGCEGLTAVTIPESVTTIGEGAFSKWVHSDMGTSIQNVYISDMAAWCGIDFGDGGSNPLREGAILYLNGEPVEHLQIPKEVTTISDYAFFGCEGLTAVTIPEGVTTIGEDAFHGCVDLTTVTIPEGMTTIGEDAFYSSGLISASIPTSVTSIGDRAFSLREHGWCHVLYAGTEEQWYAINASDRYEEYYDKCLHYETTGDVVRISEICAKRSAYCSLCESIVFEGALEDPKHHYQNGICTYCGLPEGLIYSKVETPPHIEIVDYTGNAHELDIPAEIEGLPVTVIGNLAFYGCTGLTAVTIPDGLISIGESAFTNCGLTSITIPDSVTSIGESAFRGCEKLTSVTIGSGVTKIDWYTFYACIGLKSVTIPGNVKSIDYSAFAYCINLAAVTMEDGVTEIVQFAFEWCDDLTAVTIPDSMTSIGACAFENCINLRHVLYTGTKEQWSDIPISSYNDTLVEAFRHYEVAEEAAISVHEVCCGDYVHCDICRHGVGYLPDKDMRHRFTDGICADCGVPKNLSYSIDIATCDVSILGSSDSINSLEIPDTIEQLPVTTVAAEAFKNDRALVSVTLGEYVQTVGYQAFAGCHNLVNVAFGREITTVEQAAFYETPLLTHVLYSGTRAQWMQIAVDLDNLAILNATIHYNATEDAVCWKGEGDYAYLYCNICNAALTQGCGHEHTEITDAVEPTCTKNGYTGDTYCTVCGDLVEDGEPIAALGHENQNGLCVRCGAEDPDWTEPEDPFVNPFIDVKENAYFYSPVLWAVEKGITNGTTTTTFSPEDPCTRGQIVTFLWRAFGSPEPEKDENPFTDVPENMYYYKAILWAVEQGITTGTSATTFSPEDTCTRGQVATFLWRACGKPAPESSDNPFSDVPEAMYYYEPILWAVEEGVTNGTGNGKFSPDDSCTRGQIVTFLYRALAK